MHKVSICITTYNRGESLPRTLDSVLQQDFTDFELIISDDNSTDNTRVVCEEYARKDARVKYFRNPANLKMPGNLNAAIARAAGDFIANLHDGDIYRADLIRKWHDALVAHPDALFVFNQYQMLDKHDQKILVIDHKLPELNEGKVLSEYFFRTLSSAPWGTVMARKEAYQQYGMFNPAYEFISDVEMWLRLGSHGKVCYVSEPLIDLTPREQTHKYFLPFWRITYLNIKIMHEYYAIDNAGVSSAVINSNIRTHLFRSFLILLKYFAITRAREYLWLIFASPFNSLKFICLPFGLLIPKKPTDFDKKNWQKILVFRNPNHQ